MAPQPPKARRKRQRLAAARVSAGASHVSLLGLQMRLYSLAGEVAGLAGWLSADMGHHDRALIYFDNGIKAAQEASRERRAEPPLSRLAASRR